MRHSDSLFTETNAIYGANSPSSLYAAAPRPQTQGNHANAMELSLEDLGFREISYEQPNQSSVVKQTSSQQHQQLNRAGGSKGRQRDQQSYGFGGQQSDRDIRSVYVSNLGPSINRDQLTQLFSSCGSIRCITIPRSPETQQTLGHAYVEFSSPAEAEAAVKLHRQLTIKGRLVSVNPKRTNIRGFEVFSGHMGMARRGRRGGMLGHAGMSFGRQGAVFPQWGPGPYQQ